MNQAVLILLVVVVALPVAEDFPLPLLQEVKWLLLPLLCCPLPLLPTGNIVPVILNVSQCNLLFPSSSRIDPFRSSSQPIIYPRIILLRSKTICNHFSPSTRMALLQLLLILLVGLFLLRPSSSLSIFPLKKFSFRVLFPSPILRVLSLCFNNFTIPSVYKPNH